MKWFTNFRELLFNEELPLSCIASTHCTLISIIWQEPALSARVEGKSRQSNLPLMNLVNFRSQLNFIKHFRLYSNKFCTYYCLVCIPITLFLHSHRYCISLELLNTFHSFQLVYCSIPQGSISTPYQAVVTQVSYKPILPDHLT